MKFLEYKERNPDRDVMPLNIIYNAPQKDGYHYKKGEYDAIDIIFKDMSSGEKYVQTIVHPKVEVYIVKPEFRHKAIYQRDYINLKMVDKYTVHYLEKTKEIADILKIKPSEVDTCPWVYSSDVDIRRFYMMHFLMEYRNENPKQLSVGFIDIENDIIAIPGFPQPGECPINAVTYIDSERLQSYTFCLRNQQNPLIAEFEDAKENFIKELHDNFDETYGDITYNLLFFSDELKMIEAIFKIIKESDNDFMAVWNLPYDLSNFIQRIRNLGGDPVDIMCDDDFNYYRTVYFKEDRNPMVHKRKHRANISMKQVWEDQMVLFAGIRSGSSKLPSVKLNAVARNVLKDTKLDYSEEANIRDLPYKNYRKFVKYNIKDVLLQLGINRKTGDFDTLYSRCYTDGLLPEEIFTSTVMLTNSLHMYLLEECGLIMGNNRNKKRYNEEEAPELIVQDSVNDTEGVDFADALNEFIDEEESEDDDEQTIELDEFGNKINSSVYKESITIDDLLGKVLVDEKGKRIKFVGAIVANSNRMLPSGTVINGVPSSKVHANVVDEDITSEYPSAMITMNLSNETMIGKVFLGEKSAVGYDRLQYAIPIYNYQLTPDEEKEYKYDSSSILMEFLTEESYMDICNLFLNLPTLDEIIGMVNMKEIEGD